MRVGVIGGGINGIMAAWELARRGCAVDLYERGKVMSETSSASTKMLHGGLRYLEHGHIRLVHEALHERAWWIAAAPELANPIEILLPVFSTHGRPRWQLELGIRLYDFLAKGSGFNKARWYSVKDTQSLFPTLKSKGLKGSYAYWDGQMDDYRLGLWAVTQAKSAGVRIYEDTPVSCVRAPTGEIVVNGSTRTYDRVVNATGPWASKLLECSKLASHCRLDLVRGSHIVLRGEIETGCVLQISSDMRIIFVLPYKGQTLVGTTEVRQTEPESLQPSEPEILYLLEAYNSFFDESRSTADIIGSFAGVRPIVATQHGNYSAASRESVIERQDKLISVFGGKWTTSRALAKAIADATLH